MKYLAHGLLTSPSPQSHAIVVHGSGLRFMRAGGWALKLAPWSFVTSRGCIQETAWSVSPLLQWVKRIIVIYDVDFEKLLMATPETDPCLEFRTLLGIVCHDASMIDIIFRTSFYVPHRQ